jgi:putative transposase
VVVKTLIEDRLRPNILVLAYCLMPDHLHLLLTPRLNGCSMLTFVDQFKGKSTKRSWPTGWSGKLWQQRYYDHVLMADEEFGAVAMYIVENPVRKGMVEDPEEYLWSGGIDRYGDWHIREVFDEWRRWQNNAPPATEPVA